MENDDDILIVMYYIIIIIISGSAAKAKRITRERIENRASLNDTMDLDLINIMLSIYIFRTYNYYYHIYRIYLPLYGDSG